MIEVLETVELDDEVLAGCRRLVAAGYRLALDDFQWFDGAEELLRWPRSSSWTSSTPPGTRSERLAALCRPYGVQLLAEKVETEDDLAFCRALGFELFQGYVLQRPQHVHGGEVCPPRSAGSS